MQLPALLREHGIDPDRVLSESGVSPTHFDDPDNVLDFATVARVLGRCAQATRCAHFGLLLGQRASLSALGPVGFLARSAPDVRSALHQLASRFRLHNRYATLSVVEEGSLAHLRFTVVRPPVDHGDQILDGAMALGFNLMRELCGQAWAPTEVHFAHAPPQSAVPFRRFFQARLRFDASETALLFAGQWLNTPTPGADPLLERFLVKHIEHVESRLGDDLVDAVRRMLPPLVVARGASLDRVAAHLGIGRRTLIRRLAAEGATYQELRDEVCHALACQLLENTRLAAREIADHLGYANASGFTRAFRRWTGTGPTQWRAARRARATVPSRDRMRSGS